MIRNYVLVEPTLGETVHQPGALMRSVRDGDGFRIELLTGPGQWEDRTALLAPYVMNGEPGAEVIGPVQAQLLERNYPWPHARTFPPSLRYNQNHDEHGKFAAGSGAHNWKAASSADFRFDPIDRSVLRDVKTYTGHGYARVNSQLRSGTPDLAKTAVVRDGPNGRDVPVTVGQLTSSMDDALAHSTTTSDVVVYRGIGPTPGAMESLQPGDEFVDHAFVSTSMSHDFASEWSPNTAEIHVPAGSHALSINDVGIRGGASALEHEVVLPRDSTYRVVSHDVVPQPEFTQHTFVLEMVP